jgi:hypothetical protein
MKIQIIKAGTANSKKQGYCASLVDEPPMDKK